MVVFNHRFLIKLQLIMKIKLILNYSNFQQINHNYKLDCIINKARHSNLLNIYSRSIKNSRFINRNRKYLI